MPRASGKQEMAGETAELLRRIDGLQEELRLLSDRVVKFETPCILQELCMLSHRVASLETRGIQQEHVVLSTEQDPTAPETGPFLKTICLLVLAVFTQRLQRSSSLVMTFRLLRDCNILPKKDLHLSLWV